MQAYRLNAVAVRRLLDEVLARGVVEYERGRGDLAFHRRVESRSDFCIQNVGW